MRKLAAVGLILLCGCEPPTPADNVNTFSSSREPSGPTYELIVIDGCDYLFRQHLGDNRSRELAHKGNCRSCWKRLIEAIHAKAEKGDR